MPLPRAAWSSGQESEALIEPVLELSEGHGSHARCREFDGQRDSVESTTHAATIARFDESRANRASCCTARSMNSRTASVSARRSDVVVSAAGNTNDGTRKTCSPPTPSGSRLVATIDTCGHDRERCSTSSATPSMTCSQLSNTISM